MIPGDQVTMISPTETEGPLESVPRMKRYVVEGDLKGGTPEQELHTVSRPKTRCARFSASGRGLAVGSDGQGFRQCA